MSNLELGAVILAMVCSLASLLGIVFAAGGLHAEVKALKVEIEFMRSIAKEWSAVLVRVGQVEYFTKKNTSDISALYKADNEVRVELASIHEE